MSNMVAIILLSCHLKLQYSPAFEGKLWLDREFIQFIVLEEEAYLISFLWAHYIIADLHCSGFNCFDEHHLTLVLLQQCRSNTV